MDVVKLWEKVKKTMKRKISEGEFELFFENVKAEKIEDNIFTLTCNSKLIKESVEKYRSQMEEIVEIVTDEEITMKFEVKKQDVMLYQNEVHRLPKETREKAPIHTGLNPRHRLDNFVVGENSRLAYNACLAVVKNPTVYNPLFIFGSSGLGKTHLMQAVGNAILEKDPTKRVYYSTSEEFANEFFKVLNSGRIQHFRDTFRALDVLLLDDIQFFEKVFGRGEGTVEEEFFHTFNKLQESGKQIIMISDRYPKDIKNLSKRLESRFVSGLSVEIQQPGYETRKAILENIVETKNIEIDDNILEYIADSVSSNVRELEGILTLITARAKLLNERITLQQVQDELANRIRSQQSKITAEKIIEIVSQEYAIPVSEMKARKKKQEIVDARQKAMFLIKDILDLNLTTIGGLFGGKDHSTVISSIRKIESRMEESAVFKKELDRIKQKIVQ